MPRLFLGLDSSTQSLSSILIDLVGGKVVDERSLNFDQALPHYGTRNGVLRGEDPTVVHAPPLMWVEALDRLFAGMKADGIPLHKVVAVSGSGQQHGSVYLNEKGAWKATHLDPRQSLVENLEGGFSRATSPVWMDASTRNECAEIRQMLGGVEAAAAATGSDCFERFTGPQIRKFFKQEPDAYARTTHIALVSSFLSTLLAGELSPIDVGDGAGMNLMDIASGDWNRTALSATAAELRTRLPALTASSHVIGKVAPYFVVKYGLNPDADAVVWSGDNPSSLIGVGLVNPGMMCISLGTSDTFFGAMRACRTDRRGEGHVFGSPAGGYMSLLCYKNGSLAREAVRDAYGLDWKSFSQALRDRPVGNEGGLMLPWFDAEIVPRVSVPGVHRRDLDVADAAANVRAVVEAQMMSMRIHSAWMGQAPSSIYATGGASVDREILRIMANVHQAPVYQFETTNSAGLGAALRAAQAHTGEDWQTVVAAFARPIAESRIDPDPAAGQVYAQLSKAYAAFEREVIESLR